MFFYKIDVIEKLKDKGYNTNRILQERLISQSSMQKMRKGEVVGIKTLEKVCELTEMQPGSIIGYKKEISPKKD